MSLALGRSSVTVEQEAAWLRRRIEKLIVQAAVDKERGKA